MSDQPETWLTDLNDTMKEEVLLPKKDFRGYWPIETIIIRLGDQAELYIKSQKGRKHIEELICNKYDRYQIQNGTITN